MGYIYNDIHGSDIKCMSYGREPMVALAYEKKIIWRSPYAVIELGVDPNSIGLATVTATGDVVSCLPNSNGSKWIIRAKLGGTCTVKITPNNKYGVEKLNVDKVDKGAITSYTFPNLLPKHTMYLWMRKEAEPFVDFLERSDLPDVFYSSLDSALQAIKKDYPIGLTGDVTVSCIKKGEEIRDPNDPNKITNLRLYLTTLKNFNKGSIYTLTIDGRNQYKVNGYSLGIIHIDKCDNIIFKNIEFIDYSNYIKQSSPEEMAAIFSTGEVTNKNKNIVVLNCTFYGDYYHTDTVHYFADYALDCKLTSNIIVDNCTFTKAAATVIRASDVEVLEVRRSTVQGSQKWSVAHPLLVNANGAVLIRISDCFLDGTDLREYGVSAIDTKEFILQRSIIANFASTPIFLNGVVAGKLSVESCLFRNNLHTYVAAYFRFIIRVEQELIEARILNNTLFMDGNGAFFQVCFSFSLNVGRLVNYNNIYIDKVARCGAFIALTDSSISNYVSGNNLYKGVLHVEGKRFNSVRVLECPSFKATNGIKDERDLAQFQEKGFEEFSHQIADDIPLLTTEIDGKGNYAIASKYAEEYLSDKILRSEYDINYYKIVTVPTRGAYNINGIVWDETADTDEGYNGTNMVDNTSFSHHGTRTVPSDDTLLFKATTQDRTKLIRFTLYSKVKNILRYGNSISAFLECEYDKNGMYIRNTFYDVELIKEAP